MSNEDTKKEIDVDFNEALRRIAHTPKGIIEKIPQQKKSPPSEESGDKSKKTKD